MSNYGPPDGQYPGQPSDPWQHEDPYGSPEQWTTPSMPSPYTAQPGYDPQGGFQQPGYGAQPAWGPPAAPPKKRGPGTVVAIVAVLVVLLCGGGLVALYLIGKNTSTPNAQQTQGPGGMSQATTHPTAAASSATGNAPTSDALDPVTAIKVGDCVINNGSDKQADLQIVPCGPKTYKVLARFDNTLDYAKCSKVQQYTHYFTYETTPKTDDFVLCLKQQ